MTERKHLKRLVRRRMARTGESYTTALRHVVSQPRDGAASGAPGDLDGRDATFPEAVIAGYRRFGGGLHRDSALLSHVLEQAGITLSEAMLAGLGGGIGFMYFVFEYKGHHPMMTIVAQAHPAPMIPTALERAGIPHEIKRTGSATVAERNLRQSLAAGRAAICRVGHEVAVVGIDGDTLYVDDRRVGPCEWPIDRFMTAWSGDKKNRHHMVTVTGSATADLKTAVPAAIRATAEKLTGPVLGNTFDVNFGLSGMRKLADQLGDMNGKKGWARRFADPEAFFIGMTRLHDCLELEFTAPAAMRPLYADFLDEAGGWSESAQLYREAGELWAELASNALLAEIPQFTRYRDIVAEREELLLTEGWWAAAARLQELTDESSALAGEYAATDQLGQDNRREHLAKLAVLATRAADIEEAAAALLHKAD